ncbi:polysaccharide deacetylase family protein [Candidatus Leptofilum sp.]|uniref:polysaccharide deacetylase family protein n=1 Tax=Candidatus Leptofilum sp. TaxID=3241576 RepID=UPI003B5C2877
MAEKWESTHVRNGRGGELFGSLLLFVLLLFFVGTVLNERGAGETAVAIASTAAPESNVLNTVAPTPTIANTATPTYTPTVTQTPTPSQTPTSTPTHTPSITPNPLWTATATMTPSPIPPLPTPQDGISSTITVTVPILMYHYISIPPEDADIYRTDLSVSPDNFQAQMQYLADNGHTPIDFYTLSRAITNHEPLPPKPVILTFDDGYLDNYENAYPILQQFGFVGTFFIPTEFIDSNRAGYMTWPMIEAMATSGHRFEPHSRTHPDLRARDDAYLIWEILGPQETLAFHIGYTPRYFSYPAGRYDENVLSTLQRLDFWGAVTTFSGDALGFANRFTWPRLRVRNDTPLPEFVDLVNSTWE